MPLYGREGLHIDGWADVSGLHCLLTKENKAHIGDTPRSEAPTTRSAPRQADSTQNVGSRPHSSRKRKAVTCSLANFLAGLSK